MLKSLLDDMDEFDLEKLHTYSKRFSPKMIKILRETIVGLQNYNLFKKVCDFVFAKPHKNPQSAFPASYY
ncbi:hypothetical protein B6U81_03415 [Thermoplasmatales archaeon ex4484_30]|nr:MAG: hypothetical protein B6U81_03415 [Thermoplasmatales archaeon ex4484_30]